ncbi:MAG: cytochrome b/b6 domain-containing protein [Anaerolineales bacterium]
MSQDTPKRYSPLWVTLHWAIALLLLTEFSLGLSIRFLPADQWPNIMRWHVPVGISILLLMIVRLIVRQRTPRPAPATAGSPLLDMIGVATHHTLYLLAILMPLAGISLALVYGLLPIQVGAAADLLWRFGSLHKWIAIALALLIGLHIGAAFYHQLFSKDNLLSRMWYPKSS